MGKMIAGSMLGIMLISGCATTSASAKTRYAKSEIGKAVGKCVGTVFGGAILGAILGGKKNRKKGAIVGALAGGAVCAVLVRNAKRKDKIIAAQRETAQRNAVYTTTFQDDKGSMVQYTGQVGETKTIESSNLRPVKYLALGGGKARSPVLDTGGAECRRIDSKLGYGNNGLSNLPNQVFCRTDTGDWEPYSVTNA